MMISTKGRYALRFLVDVAEHQAEPSPGGIWRAGCPGADGGTVGPGGLSGAGARGMSPEDGLPDAPSLAGTERGDF